jgi:hypothetical protein
MNKNEDPHQQKKKENKITKNQLLLFADNGQ